MVKKKLLVTAGYLSIGLGLYLIYKGSDLEPEINMDDIIDAEFTIIED